MRTFRPLLGFALLALVPLAARLAPEAYALNLASRALLASAPILSQS
jgi:hypothetical protein